MTVFDVDLGNHYWEVADASPGSQVYSSATKGYVSNADATYISWLSEGRVPSKIATQVELFTYLMERHEEGLPLSERLKGVRPYDFINYLEAQGKLGQFITEIGGAQSVNFIRLLTIERLDVTMGPVQTALSNIGVTVNNVPIPDPKPKWSNER